MDLGKVITAMVTPIHPEKDKVCKKRNSSSRESLNQKWLRRFSNRWNNWRISNFIP